LTASSVALNRGAKTTLIAQDQTDAVRFRSGSLTLLALRETSRALITEAKALEYSPVAL